MPVFMLELLFEDADYVAVNKPAGLPSIPGRGESENLLSLLADQLKLPWTGQADPRLRVVHRLDKDTSGVLLLAKNLAAQRHVSQQFQNNLTRKQYLALVAGSPTEATGHIDADLSPHPTSPKRMTVVRHGGRHAQTDWVLEERFRDFSLLRVFPRTGKTHQIRVHLLHAGLPLAVDPLYHPGAAGEPAGIFLSKFKRAYKESRHPERPLIGRLTLHAEKLAFDHLSGQPIEIIAPLPKDFRATLNMLRRHSSRPMLPAAMQTGTP
jgi:23S rRNA pseudouridine1911/1915/1917 synthase